MEMWWLGLNFQERGYTAIKGVRREGGEFNARSATEINAGE
jgi:hypothetical protein